MKNDCGLAEGFHELSAGRLATVVTSLEMRERPAPVAIPEPPSPAALRTWSKPDTEDYRELYRAVGEHWLWFSRLRMADAALAEILHDDRVRIFAVEAAGERKGLLELDFREPGTCELAFFGLAGDLIGKGMGRWLMLNALQHAWAQPIERLWVHTCTFDHPSALDFYRRFGFVPFKRQVEVVDDPRLDGTLSATAAPQIPLLVKP